MTTRPYKAATESARAEWTPEVREFRERLGEQLTVEAAAQAAPDLDAIRAEWQTVIRIESPSDAVLVPVEHLATVEAALAAAHAETEQYRRNEVTLTNELSRARQDAAEFCGQRDEARAALAALRERIEDEADAFGQLAAQAEGLSFDPAQQARGVAYRLAERSCRNALNEMRRASEEFRTTPCYLRPVVTNEEDERQDWRGHAVAALAARPAPTVNAADVWAEWLFDIGYPFDISWPENPPPVDHAVLARLWNERENWCVSDHDAEALVRDAAGLTVADEGRAEA